MPGGCTPLPCSFSLQICTFIFNHFRDAPPATFFFSCFCIVAAPVLLSAQLSVCDSPLRFPYFQELGRPPFPGVLRVIQNTGTLSLSKCAVTRSGDVSPLECAVAKKTEEGSHS